MENHESEFTDQVFTLDLASPLAVNDTINLSLFSQPIFEGFKNFDLLFYYESVLKNSKPRYLFNECFSCYSYILFSKIILPKILLMLMSMIQLFS